MIIIYSILFFILTIIKSFVHLKIDLLCDDYCTDLLINDISIKDEVNLDTQNQYYFRTINITANKNDKITFESFNSKSVGGIAVRITIFCNGNQYIKTTKDNEDLFSFNISDSIRRNQLSIVYYDKQLEEFKQLYEDISYTFGPYNIYENTYISYYFIVPDYGDEFVFLYHNLIKIIIDDYTFDISDFIEYNSPAHIIDDYNFLYFFKDDDVELKGEFFFADLNQKINFKEFYDYNSNIKYKPKSDTFYYSEKIYFLLSYSEFIEPNSYGTIQFTICPNYCIECTIDKICYTAFSNIQLEEKYLINNVKTYYNQILINNYVTGAYIFSSTNNYIQNSNYPQPDLMNCEIKLKEYLDLDYLNITVNYDNDYKISKGVIVYDSEYSIIALINDLSICSKENIFYDESSKSILECYETCKTCYGAEVNNCKSCYDNKILTSRDTCVDVYAECGDNKSLWLFEAIDNGEIECLTTLNCPSIATNVISETLECVNSCDDINSDLKCISCSNKETQIYNSCVDLSDSKNSMKIIEENIVKLLETNPLINTENKSYYIKEYPSSSSSVQTNISEINLGDCEDKLREKYDIPDDEKLILLQIETKIEGQPTSKLEYYVYSSDGTSLDLSVCSNSDISITKAITDTSNLNYDTAKSLANEGVDIYNINDDFFTDFCNGIDIQNQDLTLENRIDDVYVNVSFCDEGCEYQGINLETNKVQCSCNLNQTNAQNNITNTTKKKNKFLKVINDLLNNINYKIVVCYQYWLKNKYLKHNSGFYLSTIIFGILQILLIIICFCWYETTKKKIKENVKKINFNEETTQNNIPINKKGNKSYISIYTSSASKKFFPKIKKNAIQILHDIDYMITERSKNKNNENIDIEYKNLKRKMIEMSKIKSTFYNYFNYRPDKKISIKKTYDKKNNKKKNSTNTVLELVTSNNFNDEKDKNTYPNTDDRLSEDNKNEYEEKDIDYDGLNYFDAIKVDKRKFINIIWHSALRKIDTIALFIHIGKYEYFPLLFSAYLYSLILDFTINALLFSDDIISSKYKNGGELTFWESWILSVVSNIFGKILNYYVVRYTLYNKN